VNGDLVLVNISILSICGKTGMKSLSNEIYLPSLSMPFLELLRAILGDIITTT
jgi:hypothetical protein